MATGSNVKNRIAQRMGLTAYRSDPENELDPLGVSEDIEDTDRSGDQTPYDNIQRAGAEPHHIIPGPSPGLGNRSASSPPAQPMAPQPAPMDDYSNDPLMKNFERDRDELSSQRAALAHANGNNNIIQALTQVAQGVNAPRDNSSLYANMNSQNSEMAKGLQSEIGSRDKVIAAIQQRKALDAWRQSQLALNAQKVENTKEGRDRLTDAYNHRTDVSGKNVAANNDLKNNKFANQLAGEFQKDPIIRDFTRKKDQLAVDLHTLDGGGMITETIASELAAGYASAVGGGRAAGLGATKMQQIKNTAGEFQNKIGELIGKPQEYWSPEQKAFMRSSLARLEDSFDQVIASQTEKIRNQKHAVLQGDRFNNAVDSVAAATAPAPRPTAQTPPDPKDAAAIEWLKQNPNDPAAAGVKAKLVKKGLANGL
jgi:hypothetical protein